MKYFFDTEFIEHKNGLELISIGIVSETGKKFYAETAAFDERLADEWVHKNVIDKLVHYTNSPESIPYKTTVYKDDENLVETYDTIPGIKDSIIEYLEGDLNPIFYAYYADYDWVVFCKIFGRMIELPDYFPMYCRDLKQMLDESLDKMTHVDFAKWDYKKTVYYPEMNLKEKLKKVKQFEEYPIQDNIHNALDDALWNLKLYKFINKLKQIKTV